MPMMGEDPVFVSNRSTGLSNSLIGGIPTVDFISRLAEATTLPAQALRDDKEITRKELENVAKLFWFQNMSGWQNLQRAAFDYAQEQGVLPEKSEVEREARKADKEDDKTSWTSKTLFGLPTE